MIAAMKTNKTHRSAQGPGRSRGTNRKNINLTFDLDDL